MSLESYQWRILRDYPSRWGGQQDSTIRFIPFAGHLAATSGAKAIASIASKSFGVLFGVIGAASKGSCEDFVTSPRSYLWIVNDLSSQVKLLNNLIHLPLTIWVLFVRDSIFEVISMAFRIPHPEDTKFIPPTFSHHIKHHFCIGCGRFEDVSVFNFSLLEENDLQRQSFADTFAARAHRYPISMEISVAIGA